MATRALSFDNAVIAISSRDHETRALNTDSRPLTPNSRNCLRPIAPDHPGCFSTRGTPNRNSQLPISNSQGRVGIWVLGVVGSWKLGRWALTEGASDEGIGVGGCCRRDPHRGPCGRAEYERDDL